MTCSLNELYITKVFIYHLHGEVFYSNNGFYHTSDIYFFYEYSTFQVIFERAQV